MQRARGKHLLQMKSGDYTTIIEKILHPCAFFCMFNFKIHAKKDKLLRSTMIKEKCFKKNATKGTWGVYVTYRSHLTTE